MITDAKYETACYAAKKHFLLLTRTDVHSKVQFLGCPIK